MQPQLCGWLPGRQKKLFLSKDDNFMVNSFRINVDTNDINHILYLNEGGIEIDVGLGETEYQKHKKKLDEEQN